MRIHYIFVLLITLLFVFGCTSTEKIQEQTSSFELGELDIYTNNEIDFQIKYPQNWKVQEIEEENIVNYSFFDDTNPTSSLIVGFMAFTDKQAFDIIKENMRELYKNISNEEDIKIISLFESGDDNYYVIDSVEEVNNGELIGKLKRKRILTHNSNAGIDFYFMYEAYFVTGSNVSYSANEEKINEIIASFKLTGDWVKYK